MGTAAFNINGQTLHLAFTVNKSKNHFLGEDNANTLRTKLQYVQLLIIDEISMVNTRRLNTINFRLQQIKKCNASDVYFGNISVLAVGDFHQTTHVKGKQLCNQNNSLTDIWRIFHLWELNKVVRQQGDVQFVNMILLFLPRVTKYLEVKLSITGGKIRGKTIRDSHVPQKTPRWSDCHEIYK